MWTKFTQLITGNGKLRYVSPRALYQALKRLVSLRLFFLHYATGYNESGVSGMETMDAMAWTAGRGG